MSFMNTNLRVLCGLALLLICSGCPDPDQVADDFIADREELDTIVPVEGFCPEFSDASGTYMIAVLTPLDQSKYLLMQADVEMADIDSSPTIKMVLTPLSVAERAPVGTPIETEAVPVNPDGSFVLPFGNVAVTGGQTPSAVGTVKQTSHSTARSDSRTISAETSLATCYNQQALTLKEPPSDSYGWTMPISKALNHLSPVPNVTEILVMG